MHGYKDGDDYYERSRLAGKLHRITSCPTLLMTTMDDPLVQRDSYPIDEIKGCPNLAFAATEKGGHCCHLVGSSKEISKTFPLLNYISWLFPS